MYSNPHALYLITMSDSELFLVKEIDEVEENISRSGKVEKLLELKLPNELDREAPSSSTDPQSCDQPREVTGKEERYGDCLIFSIESKQKQQVSLSLEDQLEVEDDDSGFRTPTSIEHRMNPETMQCPPAPRKPKPSLKRKASQSSFVYMNPPSDLSKEVDSLFPAIPHSSDDYQSTQQNSKSSKSRRC